MVNVDKPIEIEGRCSATNSSDISVVQVGISIKGFLWRRFAHFEIFNAIFHLQNAGANMTIE